MSAVPEKPDAAFLSAVLRAGPGGEHWPARFRWDYSRCENCAIGMASRIWDIGSPKKGKPFMDALGLNRPEFNTVFDFLHNARGLSSRDQVTPTDVADALDDVIAARSVQS